MFTPQISAWPYHDDALRHLLGIMGQHLQRRERLSLRAFLLGLRGRNFSRVADLRADHGLDNNGPTVS